MQELITKQALKDCNFCKEKEKRIKAYEEDIEKEKIVHCQMALERENIAKGMQCTRIDEKQLRETQKMQMYEKRLIEEEREDVERMWHQVLVDSVRMKEEYERREAERLNHEMIERRHFYDEQIASANRKRQEAIKKERETENRRLEKMKKKMEQDYYDALKRKKDQQLTNKHNFIEGHEVKMLRLINEKKQERELDNKTISAAMEELRKEKQKMKNEIQTLRAEEQIFVENFNRERKMAEHLERNTDKIIIEWEKLARKSTDEKIKFTELQQLGKKEKAAQEYKRHVENRRQELEKERRERVERMGRVKETAYAELRRNLDSANEEMRRQIEYRNTLRNQIKQNQKIMEAELNSIECKQRPFTKKAIMFREAMRDKVNNNRVSTNPVHPFRRIMQSEISAKDSQITLPSLSKLK